uniref:Uncharacterized protein n=1 Tax=Papilio xuthus TaxID=66420 RepID=I4DQN1_PAPXU|nr:unknown unsecreted protein [Papilio xuthus]
MIELYFLHTIYDQRRLKRRRYQKRHLFLECFTTDSYVYLIPEKVWTRRFFYIIFFI